MLSSRFKRPSSAEIEFLGVGSIDATTRELGYTGRDVLQTVRGVRRHAPFETWGISSLAPSLNLAPCLQKWPMFNFPMALSLCQVVMSEHVLSQGQSPLGEKGRTAPLRELRGRGRQA